MRPRYSMRCVTSVELGATSEPLTISPTCVIARYRNVGIPSPHRGHAQHFGGRGYARPAFRNGVLHHRGHAAAPCDIVQNVRIRGRSDEVAHFPRHFQDLEDADSAAIAEAAAAFAAARLPDHVAWAQAASLEPRVGGDIFSDQASFGLAALAENAHEPLGDDGAKRRFEEKSLDAEVEQ